MYKRNYNFLNFKAKTTDTDEWVYGTPVKTEDDRIILIDSSLKQTEIRRKTLCQKTNSKDTKDQEIFEGDLVVTVQGVLRKNQIVGCVRFGEEPGYLDSTVNAWKIHWSEPLRFDTYDFEKIGNVYDIKFHDEAFLKENWPEDWENIKYFVEKEADETDIKQ